MVLYRRKWIILLMVLTASISAWFLSQKLPPVYEARTLFFVPQQPDRPTFFAGEAPKPGAILLSPTPKEDAHASFIGISSPKRWQCVLPRVQLQTGLRS